MFVIFVHYSTRPIYDVSMNLFCLPSSVGIFNILPGFLWQPLLNSHNLVLFKNPRDKLQILTLVKQMYPGQTDVCLKQYKEAVKRPVSYLLIDPKITPQDYRRLRTNVLPMPLGRL